MHENPAPALSFRSLTKTYRVYAAPRDRLIEAFTGRKRHVEVPALHDVSGDVPRGTALGIVGQNGSGKSTLLKILAGTTTATSGSVVANGRIASILELGAAFHPEETGRRNVILQAALYGLTQKETVSVLPDVESFAELGDFFDRPVRTYSSGMAMRLAFAAATALLPDTVILDEALAVGDGRFQKKCVDRIFGLRASGRTIVFCSHAMYYVSTLCDHAIWLRGGEVAAFGESQYVVLEYERFLAAQEARNPKGSLPEIGSDTHGRFVSIGVSGADGSPRKEFRPGEPWFADLEFVVDDADRPVQLHVAVSTRDNVVCFAADSRTEGFGPLVGSTRYHVRLALDALPLGKGEFILYTYLADDLSLAIYDARSDVAFHVESPRWSSGLLSLPCRWERL